MDWLIDWWIGWLIDGLIDWMNEYSIEKYYTVNILLYFIWQLRDEVGKLYQQPAEKLCLVYGGKIMKDEDSIKSYGVKNQHSVHLVIRNPPSSGAPSSAPQAASANITSGSLGGLPFLPFDSSYL